MRLLALLLALLLFAPQAQASRGCGTTFGVGATDAITSTYTSGFSGTVTYAFWAWVNAAGGGSRVFNKGATVATVDALQMAPGISFFPAFSTTRGTFTTNLAPSSSAWHSVVIAYDGSLTTNVPTIYVDGASVLVTTIATPVGTRTVDANAYVICNSSAGNRNFDGMLSDFSIWNVMLTANEALAFSKGTSPLKIRSGALQFYLPLSGNWSSEQDWSSGHKTQTLTGTKAGTKNPPNGLFPFNQNDTGR